MSPRAPGFVPPALVTSSPDSQPRASVGVHRGGEIQTGKRMGKATANGEALGAGKGGLLAQSKTGASPEKREL